MWVPGLGIDCFRTMCVAEIMALADLAFSVWIFQQHFEQSLVLVLSSLYYFGSTFVQLL